MEHLGIFPFGQPVLPVRQADRSRKTVFVLGVYASAVHARWGSAEGKSLVSALAVASEPSIFWRGENAARVIEQILIPPEAGRLEPAEERFNGPSGIALDELILHPLGLTREDAWLCDLVPYSCKTPGQKKAVERAYMPLVESHDLPIPSVREVPQRLADERRQDEIAGELQDSEARILILLGDEPIKWFLKRYEGNRRRLAQFGEEESSYGRLHPAMVHGRELQVLPLVHPRQAAKLGAFSERWFNLHREWMRATAPSVLGGNRLRG